MTSVFTINSVVPVIYMHDISEKVNCRTPQINTNILLADKNVVSPLSISPITDVNNNIVVYNSKICNFC